MKFIVFRALMPLPFQLPIAFASLTLKMGIFEIFTAELMAFSVVFTFLPMVMVKEWRQRGSADGFSSVNFVLPVLMMSCWFRHGWMTNDPVNLYLNGFNLIVYAFYLGAFAYYQPKRQNLSIQVGSLAVALYALFVYVDTEPDDVLRADLMSAVAAGTQLFSLVGGIYEIKRVIDNKTTEYLPAPIQFGIFLLVSQWTVFALLVGNYHMFLANAAGLVVNIATIALYFVYPPLTWTVPIFNIQPQKKKD
uniref:Sugar transporter SWEET n=1 Tax=Panagrellus redivivus TaxID=6233 RepID=A0A7E4UM12_PANRE